MAIKSTFSSGAYRVGGAFVFVTVMLLLFLVMAFVDFSFASISLIIPVSVFGFSSIVLFRGDVRKKAIKVGIDSNTISVSRYFGFGPKKTYELSSFDGYITTIIPAKNASYEHLYLKLNNETVIILSQFYLGNYDQLKFFLEGAVPFLGHEEFKKPTNLRELLRS